MSVLKTIVAGRILGQPVILEVGEYIDDWEIAHTTLEFVKRRPDGIRVRIPVAPPIKIKTYTRETSLGEDDTVEITERDARRLFRDNWKLINAA